MKTMKKVVTMMAISAIGLLGSCTRGNVSTNSGTNNNSQNPNSSHEEQSGEFVVTYKGNEFEGDGTASITVGDNASMLLCTMLDGTTGTFSYESSDSAKLSVSSTGKLTPLAEGTASITVKNGDKAITITFTIIGSTLSSGGQTYTSVDYEEKARILGALEKYAVDNYLTGITIFSNGSKVAYNERYIPAPQSYINGYGWGTTREGKLTSPLEKAVSGKKTYYNIGTTSLPAHANAMNANGSDVSTVYDYISTSYYGTRMNETNDGYEWYPVLATDDKPIAVAEPTLNKDGTVKTPGAVIPSTEASSTNNRRWRIHLRSGVKYRTGSSNPDTHKYDGTEVKLTDYLTPLKFMLTGWNAQFRGAELTDGTSGITGAASYYSYTSKKSAKDESNSLWNDTAWNTMVSSNLYTGHDEKGDFIEFNLLESCSQFYAMYYLSSSLYSPLPEDFIKLWGYKQLGKSPTGSTPLDTMLATGPYYIESWSDQVINFKKNEQYFITEDDFKDGSTPRKVYNIDGISYNYVGDASELKNKFMAGEIDSYGPKPNEMTTGGEFSTDSGTSASGVKWRLYETKGDSNFKLNVNASSEEDWLKRFNEENGKNAQVKGYTSTWKKLKADLNGKTPKTACKPYMNNIHFLNFLSFSINRKEICESRGSIPTQEYFSDNYIIDPEKGVSYNSTEAHKAVLADRFNDNYGFNETYAAEELKKAFDEVLKPLAEKGAFSAGSGSNAGTSKNPWKVIIDMEWMNTTDSTDYKDVFSYTKKIFKEVSNTYADGSYTLDINETGGNSDYQQVYNLMKQGQFDLGFGSVSGNALNPIDFIEVLKSDNSSTFTLNWGPDTSVVGAGLYSGADSYKNNIVYDGKKWSFDGLWSAADKGTLLNDKGGIAAVENVSSGNFVGGTRFDSFSKTDKTITYKLSFKQLIEAGATSIKFQVSNSTSRENWKKYSVNCDVKDYVKLNADDGVVTLTIGNEFNRSYGSETDDATSVSLTIEYDAILHNGLSSETGTITKSFSDILTLVTFAGYVQQ